MSNSKSEYKMKPWCRYLLTLQKKISPDAQMQEYLAAKCFIVTGADCWESLSESRNRSVPNASAFSRSFFVADNLWRYLIA